MKNTAFAFLASLVVAQTATPALAYFPGRPAAGAIVNTAALDCHAIGQKKADELGGQLAKASPVIKNGQEACLVVILIPAKDGNRPRRAEFVISN